MTTIGHPVSRASRKYDIYFYCVLRNKFTDAETTSVLSPFCAITISKRGLVRLWERDRLFIRLTYEADNGNTALVKIIN